MQSGIRYGKNFPKDRPMTPDEFSSALARNNVTEVRMKQSELLVKKSRLVHYFYSDKIVIDVERSRFHL